MTPIKTVQDLEARYGMPGPAATQKVARRMTPEFRTWLTRSRFCILSTVGPEGTDASPRGDDGAVVRELDAGTLALPDWRGNNRIDSLRNIVRDPRVSLMLFVPGSNNVVRINGRAFVTGDDDLCRSFEKGGRHPRTVIVIEISEIYTQCARALIRSGLWAAGDESAGLPSVGDILAALTEGRVGGKAYDEEWPERAANSMW
ncbi:pyridoxamine 5'-phosphate oxidase family protein [Celeribacter baekdonensis]|uniref:pyridoxamine 5'-phosphate oxidase family protein n=1 Tax=Celeribacter baekdonensis TaxID=875171 RepID=UPI003A94B65F